MMKTLFPMLAARLADGETPLTLIPVGRSTRS